MEIFINVLSDEVISIVIEGDFTIAETSLFDSIVFPVFNRDRNNIVLDMVGLTFIDSFGIGKLFSAINIARLKGKELYIMNVREDIENLFNTVKLFKHYNLINRKELESRFGIKGA